MPEFICPLCQKNLTIAFKTLGDPVLVSEFHVEAHINQMDENIRNYVIEHKQDLPLILVETVENREKAIKILREKITEFRKGSK